MKRILLIGATGVFGERLARMIARWPDATLILAARRLQPLRALAARLDGPARIETAAFDRTVPEGLAALRPWAVVDATGPFQASDYRLPLAAIAAGAHYVDLADGRAFVAGFEAAVGEAARAAGLCAFTGASSTPALAQAVLDELTADLVRIDTVAAAISPGGRAPRGISALRAILSWVGRPVRVFNHGHWEAERGWGMPWRHRFPGIGWREVVLADTPDLDVMAERQAPAGLAVFRAGVESKWAVRWLGRLSRLVRWGLVRDLTGLAPLLNWMAGPLGWFASDRGGMIVEALGRDAAGRSVSARWALWAEPGLGPNVPAAPAAAVLRDFLDGGLGGWPRLDAILAQLPPGIHTRRDVTWRTVPGLFQKLLGPKFAVLPPTVRAAHAGTAAVRMTGQAVARGSPLAAPVRWLLGLPGQGRHPARVDIELDRSGDELWTRRFGRGRFATRISRLPFDQGAFEESSGPIHFRIRLDPDPRGFTWVLDGWRFGFGRTGGWELPRRWAPIVRARSFERDGTYRFSVLVAHPWLGVIFAYAGRLATSRAD